MHFMEKDLPAQRLREAYGKLIENMPQAAHDKLGPLPTPEERVEAVFFLLNKHTGELVESDPAQSWWRLALCEEGASNFLQWRFPKQFQRYEGGGVPTQLSDEDFVTHRKQRMAWHPKVLRVM